MSKNLSVCLSVTLKWPYFSGRVCELIMVIYKILFDLASNQNQKPFAKKVATLAARAVFESRFFSSSKKKLICDFWAGNNYPDSPHSQGGIKFATQISPLLNL